MITLSDGTTTIELHKDLLWSDEGSWNPVEQKVERTLTGALIVSSAPRQAGRPITLQPEREDTWHDRTTVDAVRNFAAAVGQELTLTLRGVERTVLFRHQDIGFEFAPVVHYNDVASADFYLCTFRFMEI